MLKLSIAAGSLGLMALALPMQAHAQYGYGYNDPGIRNVQCERQKSDNSAAGTVVGALAGALIGGAVGNNIENDRTYTEYNRRGRPIGRYTEGRSESGNVAVGALLGALVGGVAGNSIAGDSGPDCQVAYAPYNYSSSPSGSIPRSTDGLYGGPEVMSRGGYRSDPYPASYPREAEYRSYPDDRGAPQQDCRVIQRETRLPDGDVQRDPVTACWNDGSRQWQVQDGYSDDPYGY
jgi:hypothetical protein